MTQVYAAKYSNVPVWVANVNNVSVMRRQGDGWVNATHLLKVADFDKPRRTRILERDVQTGEHEKVQGGYGKYQGTWIPVERAFVLSKQVNILEQVEDLLTYAPKEGVATLELPRQTKPQASRKQPSSTTLSGQKVKRARKVNSMPSQSIQVAPADSSKSNRAPQGMSSRHPAAAAAHQQQFQGGQPTIGRVPRAQAMQSMPSLPGGYQNNMAWPQFSPQSPYNAVIGTQTPTQSGNGSQSRNIGQPGPMTQAGQQLMGQVPMSQMQMMPMGFPIHSPYYVSDMSPTSAQAMKQSLPVGTSPVQQQMDQSHAGGVPGMAYSQSGIPMHQQPGRGAQPVQLGSSFSKSASGARTASSSPSMSSSVLSSNDDGFSDTEMNQPYGHASSSANAHMSVNNSSNALLSNQSGNLHSSVSRSGAGQAPRGVSNPGRDVSAYNAQAAARVNAWTQGPSNYMADYSSKLLNFFMSPDKTVIPASLLQPEPGMDLDHPIDDEGNTAFHWTCAIGRIELIRALIKAGVNKHALNKSGQNALSFLVMFTNNYETRTFPKVLDLLSDQVSFVDQKGRTILHHIANTATSSSRSATARYYAEILLAKVSSYSPRSAMKNAGNNNAASNKTVVTDSNKNTNEKNGFAENGNAQTGTSAGETKTNSNSEGVADNHATRSGSENAASSSPSTVAGAGATAAGTAAHATDSGNSSSKDAAHNGDESGNLSMDSILNDIVIDGPLIKPGGFAEWLDHQDNKGDTALHIASRLDSRKLVKVLLSYKASPLVPNKLGQTPDDLYQRAKKKREADLLAGHGHRHHRHSSSHHSNSIVLSEALQLSQHAADDISIQLHEIALTYDQDLANKESDIAQVQALVTKVRHDIVDAEMSLPALRSEVGRPEDVEEVIAKTESQVQEKLSHLRQLIERSQARDLAAAVQQEEAQAQEAEKQLQEEYKLDTEKQLRLGTELAELQKHRKLLVTEIGTLYSEAGSGEKISKYRRLLAVCCEVPEDQVDGLLDGINQALDASA